jgi:hypothetical protein
MPHSQASRSEPAVGMLTVIVMNSCGFASSTQIVSARLVCGVAPDEPSLTRVIFKTWPPHFSSLVNKVAYRMPSSIGRSVNSHCDLFQMSHPTIWLDNPKNIPALTNSNFAARFGCVGADFYDW